MTTESVTGALKKARSGVGVGGSGRSPSSRERKRQFTHSRTFTLFVLPSLILLVLLNVYPVVYAGMQSLRNGDLLSAGDFVGLSNYISVVQTPAFLHATIFTIVFTVVGVFGSWAIGLALSLLLRTRIPANGLFKVLLDTWGMFDSNPPFTSTQLAALTAGDEFEVVDWPSKFDLRATPFAEAVRETYCDPTFSGVVLEF